jgi:parallel beta-helix repeat protein
MKNIEKKRFRQTEKHKLGENRDKEKEHAPSAHTFFIMSLAVICFLLLFASAGVASATNYYVSTTGNNNWDGLSPETAWGTIAYAVGTSPALAGDTIYVLDGYYPEGSGNVYFAKDGITLTADNQESPSVVIDGITKNPGDLVFEILNRNNINISKLEIKNGDNCIDVRTSTNIHISECVIHDSYGEGIVIYDDSHYCSVNNCTLYSCRYNIMMLGGKNDQPNQDFSSHLSVTNCEIYGGIDHNLLDLSGDMEHIDIKGNYLHGGDHGTFYTHQDVSGGIKYLNFSDNTISGGLDAIHFDTPCQHSSFISNTINQDVPGGMIVQFREGINNVTFRNNYIRGDVSNQILFVHGVAGNNLFDHNDVKSDYGDNEYYIRGNGDATIRNEIGLSYKVASSDSGSLTVEYTDGRTFSVDGAGKYTTYTFSSETKTINILGELSIGTISGIVTNTTGATIQGATVTDGTRSAMTDNNGKYTITNIPVGNYTVTASADGYGNAFKNVTVVANQTTRADFELNLAGDIFSPTTTYAITPTPNEAGWNNVIPVVVTFFRGDTGGSGISYTNYSKTSETGPWTTVDISAAMGPDAGNVTDISEGGFNVTVSDEVVTKIWYYSVDNNSNVENAKSITVKIDTKPPVIYNVSSSDVTGSSAIITWATDEPSTSQVEYGLTTSYGSSTTLDINLVTSHSQIITGLTINTTYHYRVQSKDAADNEIVSGDYTFTTTVAGDSIFSDIFVEAITDTSAKVYWSTDIPGTSYVKYGLGTNYGHTSTIDELPRVGHSIALTGLNSGTTYHYQVFTKDIYDNIHVSDDHTLTTLDTFTPSGKNYYVSTSGDDDLNDGLSLENAWRTITHAASQVSAGDTVWIEDGTYDEGGTATVYFNANGTDVNPIIFKAYSGSPLLTGGKFRVEGSYVTIIGLRIRTSDVGIEVWGADHVNIYDCEVFNTGNVGIHIRNARYVTVDNCEVRHPGWNSIMVGVDQDDGRQSHHNSITNCKIHDNTAHNMIDLTVHFGATYTHHYMDIINNEIYDGPASNGVFMHRDPYPSMFHVFNFANNVIYSMASNGMQIQNMIDSYIYNNTIYNTNKGSIHAPYGGCHNVTFLKNNVEDINKMSGDEILFDQNKASFVRSEDGDSIVKNHDETEFEVQIVNGAITVEYTDGKTFSVDGAGNYTTYTFSSGTKTINVFGEPSVGTISGTVTNTTGSPIQRAIVTVEGTGKSTQTASGGTYTISDVSVGTYTVTCIATGYEDASQYTVKVNEGETTTVNFQLTTETTPPTITDHSPTGTNVPVGTTITATFSEAMNKTSAENAFSISPSVSGSFGWDDNKMIFTPDSNLAYETTYIATISTEAEDLAGSNLESPFSWQFTTVSEPTPLTPPIAYVATDGSGNYNCDGTDDQIEINEAIDYVATHSDFTTVHLKAGTYIIDGGPYSIILKGNNKIFEGDSRDTTTIKLKDGNNYEPYIYLLYASNVDNYTVRNLKINGNRQNNPSHTIGVDGSDGFRTVDSSNFTIYNMIFANSSRDAMYFWNTLGSYEIFDSVVSSGHDGIFLTDGANHNIHNCTISGNPDKAIRLYRTKSCVVEYCNLKGADDVIGIYTEGSALATDTIIRNCIIRNDIPNLNGNCQGIKLLARGTSSITNTIIKNNIIYQTGGTEWRFQGGIELEARDTGCFINNTIIENNVIYDTWTGSGIEVGPRVENTIVRNNIIANNAEYGINGSNIISNYNDVFGNALGGYGGGASAGTGDISVDPLFADPANGDFHLKSTAGRWNGSDWVNDSESSPCIDVGDPNSSCIYEPEPNGGIINMGAYGNTVEASKFPGEDTTPPTITAYSPIGTGVSADTAITVTFSEAMNQSSVEGAYSVSPSVSGSFSWNGDKMIFTPSSNLNYETAYTVTIGTEAKDLAGNNLESLYSWQFTTLSPSMDLVAEWHFDAGGGTTTVDSSGNGNKGIVSDSLTMWTVEGKINSSLQFDGDDYVEVPDSRSLESITNNITLIAWIKTYSFEDHQNIIEKWDFEGVNQRSFELKIKTSGTVGWGLSPDGTSTNAVWLTSNGIVSGDVWTHLAVTSDGETMKIFINGEEDPNKISAPSGGIYKSTADLHIGRWWGGESWIWPFNGSVDEVKIYNRALSAEEIKADYEAGSSNQAPTAFIDSITPDPAEQGKDTVSFSGHGTDADGSVVAYSWSSSIDGLLSTASSFSKPASELSVGTHTIYFKVQDDDGAWSTEVTENLTINSAPGNLPPVSDSNGPYTGTEGVAITFDGSGSYDPDGSIVSYEWDFGDGGTATGMNPTHTYTQNGTYTVTLTVTDNDGATDTNTTTATIADTEPIAGFVGAPTNGSEPLTVAFTDTSISYDGITAWEWDFDNNGVTDSTVQNPTHVYNESGKYTVSLTVHEADGDSDTITKAGYITVTTANNAPRITSYAPEEELVIDTEGDERTFSISVDQPVNVSWQINGTEVKNDKNVIAASYTNTSAKIGTWNVSAIASNQNGTAMHGWTWNVLEATPLISNITITSPENKTYASICVKLNFTLTVEEGVTLVWTGYSLDGNANVTTEGNTTVSEGLDTAPYNHYIVVYARDSNGNENKSSMVFFTVHPGDVDGSLTVDVDDLEEVSKAFFSEPGDGNWNENADLNCDDVIDVDDLEILSNYFFNSY